MARRNLTIEGYDVAAFLAHQSIEKLLKAAFALSGKPLPRTHYLEEMASELGLPEDLYDKILISPATIQSRVIPMWQAASHTNSTRTRLPPRRSKSPNGY